MVGRARVGAVLLCAGLASIVSRENPSSATPAIAVPVPAIQRGSMTLTSLEAIVAAITRPKLNGRNATPVCSGE